jgi:hypothetical protein
LTNKFARRFVMVGTVKIRISHRYLKPEGAEAVSLARRETSA